MNHPPSLSIPCPSCKAEPGEPCRTTGGNETHSHVNRKKAAARLVKALRGHGSREKGRDKKMHLPDEIGRQIEIGAALSGLSQREFLRTAITCYLMHLGVRIP